MNPYRAPYQIVGDWIVDRFGEQVVGMWDAEGTNTEIWPAAAILEEMCRQWNNFAATFTVARFEYG